MSRINLKKSAKIITRSQKIKAVEELVSGEFEPSYVEDTSNTGTEQAPSPSSKSLRL